MTRCVRLCLLVVFIILPISFFQEPVVATPENDNEKFEFTVDFAEPDWSHMSINATISSKISSFPSSFLKIPCTLGNIYYFEGEPTHGGWVEYDMVPSETETVNETILVTFVNQTTANFRLLGLAEFYPYDSYLLNLTFTFAENGLANENNTSVKMNFPWWRFLGWKIETTTTIIHSGEFAEVISTATLSRSSWSIEPFRFILLVMFLVLGISYLITPKDLQSRLTIYVAILLFSITFYFQVSATAPPRTSAMSLLENLTLHLSFGTSAFLLFSVVERVLIYDYKIYSKIRGALAIETAGVVIAAALMLYDFNSYVTIAEKYFSWVKIPRLDYLFAFSLSFGLLMKYFHHGSRYLKKRKIRWRKLIRELKTRLKL